MTDHLTDLTADAPLDPDDPRFAHTLTDLQDMAADMWRGVAFRTHKPVDDGVWRSTKPDPDLMPTPDLTEPVTCLRLIVAALGCDDEATDQNGTVHHRVGNWMLHQYRGGGFGLTEYRDRAEADAVMAALAGWM